VRIRKLKFREGGGITTHSKFPQELEKNEPGIMNRHQVIQLTEACCKLSGSSERARELGNGGLDVQERPGGIGNEGIKGGRETEGREGVGGLIGRQEARDNENDSHDHNGSQVQLRSGLQSCDQTATRIAFHFSPLRLGILC